MKLKYLFILAIFTVSCQDIEENKPPEHLIPENKMVKVLTDLSVLNSAKNYNTRILEETGVKPDDYLYKKYDIDSTILAENTKYYARNYNEFEGMYARVKANLEIMKSRLEIVKVEEDRVKDSILEVKRIEDSINGIDSTSVVRDTLVVPKKIIR